MSDAEAGVGPSGGGGGVLVVDDHEQNLELLLAYLEELGCPLHGCRDGATAIEIARRERPLAVVLDVMMPRMSGFQVCEKLKADPATSGIPVVIVTALNDPGDAERARDSGADAFLTKPVDRAELLATLRGYLGA